MPTYDYDCSNCEHIRLAGVPIDNRDDQVCPLCGSKLKRNLTWEGGMQFKGKGFYITDYGRGKDTPPSGGFPNE